MNKLIGSLLLLVLGAVALGVIAPALARLVSASTAPIVAGGIVACIIRVVWVTSRRW
jgi:hypothetical protein